LFSQLFYTTGGEGVRAALFKGCCHCTVDASFQGLITIFKEQFPAFEMEVFKPLSNCYPVKIISSGGNKRKQK